MPAEIPLQFDLFTGEAVDNRNGYQKKLDKVRQQPKQQTLFSANQEADLARSVRPWLAEMSQPTLVLEIQDVRSDEEKEHDLMKAAEELTVPLFDEPVSIHTGSSSVENALITDDSVAYRVALFHLGKEELVASRPDLSGEIEQLKDTDIEVIAMEAEEALRTIYTMVLSITLSNYLNRETLASPVNWVTTNKPQQSGEGEVVS